MLPLGAAFVAMLTTEVEVDLKVIDCSREESKALGPEAAGGQSPSSISNGEAAPREGDRSTLAIVLQSAFAAVAFYLAAHLVYLYVDRWSDLDVEVIGLPSFEELDRSVSVQRAEWSSIPVVVDSPWRRVYEATSFQEAVGIIEEANACGTPDAQAFLLRAQRVCEHMGFNIQKDPGDKFDNEVSDEGVPASWSILLTMYFQDRYCADYDLGADQRCSDVGGSVNEGFYSSDDEACFETANSRRGILTSLDGPSVSGLLYVEISDRTVSPELYLRSVRGVNPYERAGVLEANGLTEEMGFDEVGSAEHAASLIAMCEIYGVCPPLGLVAMSECMPDRCPIDADLESYFQRVNPADVVELIDLWSSQLVSRRESFVRGGSGPG